MSKNTQMVIEGIGDIGYQAISRAIGTGASVLARNSAKSYVEAAQICRVEPICIVDQSLQTNPILPGLLQSTLSLFSLFYLQATTIENAISNVKVFRVLDRLNPNRNVARSVLHNTIALESVEQYGNKYDFSLPGLPRQIKQQPFQKLLDERKRTSVFVTEAFDDHYGRPYQAMREEMFKAIEEHDGPYDDAFYQSMAQRFVVSYITHTEPRLQSNEQVGQMMARPYYQRMMTEIQDSMREHMKNVEAGKDPKLKDMEPRQILRDFFNRRSEMIKQGNTGVTLNNTGAFREIHEVRDLSVGKLLHVEYTTEQGQVNVPISVRLMVNSMPPSMISDMLTNSGRDMTLGERYHALRSGTITFIDDFLMNKDVRKKRMQFRMRDTSGAYTAIKDRMKSGAGASLLTANPSLAAASNIVIMSSAAASMLESAIGGKLSNYKTREQVLDETGVMMLIVVDTERNLVTYHYHSMADTTTYTFNELKSHGKKDTNMQDMMMAFAQGIAPRL